MLHLCSLVLTVAPQIIIVDPAKQIEGAKHTPQFAKRPIELLGDVAMRRFSTQDGRRDRLDGKGHAEKLLP